MRWRTLNQGRREERQAFPSFPSFHSLNEQQKEQQNQKPNVTINVFRMIKEIVKKDGVWVRTKTREIEMYPRKGRKKNTDKMLSLMS